MKSRRFSKNLAKTVLNCFLILIIISLCGCSSSTKATFVRENIESSIQAICKEEYSIDTVVKLVGKTLWIYVPVEDMLVKADKPEKYADRFEIIDNFVRFQDRVLKLDYGIKPVPEKEKLQEYKYNKKVLEKLNNVWKVLRRIIFSLDRSGKNEPHFFCLVMSDIKSGYELKEVFYYLDLKKVSYTYISWEEYQHRAITETDVDAQIIGDREGSHLDYRDITLEEFVAQQIQHRIKMKFQKPEVPSNADIDREITKVVVYTIKTYGLRDFDSVEFDDFLNNRKSTLNSTAVWARPMD